MAPNGQPGVSVRFEGFGTGTEILGGEQANFLVARPGEHAKEVGVVVNAPALDLVVGDGAQDEALRKEATRCIAELWLERLLREGRPVDPVIFLSKSRMETVAGFLDSARHCYELAGGAGTIAGEASETH